MPTLAAHSTPRLRRIAGVVAVSGCLLLAGCGGSDQPPAASPSPPTPSASSPTTVPSESPTSPAAPSPSVSQTSSAPAADEVVIDVTIADGDVRPSGEKVDVERGKTVVLNVASDIDDEIHAHTGGDGLTLEVSAGEEASGSFEASERGSFEVESHELGKIIVILNVR